MTTARKWDDLRPEMQQELTEYLENNLVGKQIASYASGGGELDRDFAVWLVAVNVRCVKATSVTFLDLPDHMWRDCYDNELSPKEALRDALACAGYVR